MAISKKLLFSCLIITLFFPITTHAQSKNDRTVVGTVGKEKVTYAEVKNNFSSGSNNSFSIDELESFLPLYLDYKAKLLSAKDQDYYSDSALVAEHNLYAKQAAYAFWLENEIRPTVFKEYYNRATTELKSFHILVGVGENPSPEEVDNAKMKLAQAKADIKNEIPLAEVDKKYSTTRGGRSMGGDLPWLSAGRTVREFEDQLYSLQIGEISEPFATQFGYHIVLLQEKRERTPARLTNHIFVRPTQDSAAYKKIYEAYNHLDEGRSWNEVMMQYSEDDASKGNNGNIGWVSYHSNFAGDFIDVVNNFDASLDFSEPVRTNYGFHIFKVDSVQTYASEEERKDEVRAEMKRSNYYKEDNAFVVNYLKNKFGAEEFPESGKAYKDFITGLDSTLISNVTTLPFSLSSQKIFGFNGQEYTVAEYHSYLGEVEGNRMARQYRDSWIINFHQSVIDSEVINLTLKSYPNFAEQSESYLNGLVVYNINDDNVWNASTVDSTKLMEIYENNIEAYSYSARPYYYLLSASKDSILQKAINFVKEGNSLDSVRTYHNRVGVSSDSTSSFQEEPFDRLREMNPGSFSELFEYNKRQSAFYLVDNLPARRMTFDEAFNRLLAEFQPEREQAWLKQLRAKYKVKPDIKNLRKAFKNDSQSSK